MAGGVDNDTYFVDDTNDLVQEVLNQGIDTVKSTANYTLAAQVENLQLMGEAKINGIGNTMANKITGNDNNNTLSGLEGDDTLFGHDGDDVLRGGAGSDTLYGNSGADDMDGGEDGDIYYLDGSDTVFDSGTAGRDKIFALGSYALAEGNGIEDLATQATGAVNLQGNSLDNKIFGNDAANTLKGFAGADVILGGAGNDRLEGGTGRDNLTGGADADTFVFRNGDSGTTWTTFDIVQDFQTGVDKIDLQIIGVNGIPAGQYSEVATTLTTFLGALGVARTEMADGEQRAVFVAGPNDGWLFWSTDADRTTIEEAARLVGVNNLSGFAFGDLI